MTKIIALLTGRGGSSFKDKNIIKLFNKPVLAYPCEEARKVSLIDDYYVSSDDRKIINTASKYGFKSILRPKKLSKPNSLHHDVLLHALKDLKNKNIFPDLLVVLLANAPIVESKWISDCIKLLFKNKATAVVPVVQDNDKHPFRAKKTKNKFLLPFIDTKKKISSNRQSLKKSFFLCHNFWVIKTNEILKNDGYKPWSFMGRKVLPYVVKESHDIHQKIDINICKNIISQKNKGKT